LGEQLRSGAAELDAVRAPKDAREAQQQLVSGLKQLAGELPKLNKPSVTASRPLASFASSISTTEGVKTIQQAIADLRRHGYSLAPAAS
jgi:hypothetical protein